MRLLALIDRAMGKITIISELIINISLIDGLVVKITLIDQFSWLQRLPLLIARGKGLLLLIVSVGGKDHPY